jgi:hypothetical protein
MSHQLAGPHWERPVRSSSLNPSVKRLLQAALLPAEEATVVWRTVERELDVTEPVPGSTDAFALLGYRLAELGIGYRDLPRFVGIRRHNWVTSELALSELAALSVDRPDRPVVIGRPATIAAYLPEPGLVPWIPAELAQGIRGRTLAVNIRDVSVLVPAPAEHLVWALEHGRWLDAAFAAHHVEMSWEEVGGIAVEHRRPPRLYFGLVTLAELMGPSVPPEIVEAARPSPIRQLNTRAYDMTSNALYRLKGLRHLGIERST